MLRSGKFLRLGLICAILGYPTASRAEEAAESNAAEVLFASGKELMQQGRFDEACPKLAASIELDPAIGSYLHLGLCYERLGAPARAWRAYRNAEGRALGARDTDRAELAARRAGAVEPNMARVVLRVGQPPPCARGQVQLLLDGERLPSAALDLPIPVDPGRHTIEARADGCTSSVQMVETRPAESALVLVDGLGPETSSAEPLPIAKRVEAVVAKQPPRRDRESPRGPFYVLGAAGIATVAVGSFFGGLAWGYMENARDLCKSSAGCTDRALLEQDRAAGYANISTALFVGGAVITAVAGVCLASHKPNSSLRISSAHRP